MPLRLGFSYLLLSSPTASGRCRRRPCGRSRRAGHASRRTEAGKTMLLMCTSRGAVLHAAEHAAILRRPVILRNTAIPESFGGLRSGVAGLFRNGARRHVLAHVAAILFPQS